MNPRGALSGRGVLVSRPRAQAAALSDAIRSLA
jgi:uroporphyrinogen-III synthase